MNKKFCTKCGSPMKILVVGAENYCNGQGFKIYPPAYPKFDRNTGERNLMIEYRCIKKSFWSGNHSQFGVGDPFTIKTYKGNESLMLDKGLKI